MLPHLQSIPGLLQEIEKSPGVNTPRDLPPHSIPHSNLNRTTAHLLLLLSPLQMGASWTMTRATVKPKFATLHLTLPMDTNRATSSSAPRPGQSLQPGFLPDHPPEVPADFKAEPSVIIKRPQKTASTVPLITLITL